MLNLFQHPWRNDATRVAPWTLKRVRRDG